MAEKHPIAVARGDGIGPEIMDATLKILHAAKAPLEIHEVEIGEKVYLSGEKAGIAPKTWEILRKTKAFLKAPITTPQGGGFKSLNVTVRTSFGLYANVRPCVSYAPFVDTKHPKMDLVIIRENEEDLYCGVEYRQTDDVYQSLKLISSSGTEKIVRYAFEYASAHGRKKVTCFTKDNILKIADGQFHKVFDLIAKEYPHIENEHWIVDIGAAKLADTPQDFDVIVLANLYGDILSDVAAQISGSVGLAGSANIGAHGAMFEAIHGSAPRRAGQDVANPSGLLLSSCMMLEYLGVGDVAKTIHNAWLTTIEEGIHTYDIYEEGTSCKKVGTKAFADAVIERLGATPKELKAASAPKKKINLLHKATTTPTEEKKELVGFDLFFEWKKDVETLLPLLKKGETDKLTLSLIANRGVKMWPNGLKETSTVDQWRCRFKGTKLNQSDLLPLLEKLMGSLRLTQVEPLYTFNGSAGFTLAQDEQ